MSSATSYACPKCGAPVSELATTCPMCGLVRPPFGQQRRPMPAVVEQRSIGALVLSILGLVVVPVSFWSLVLGVRSVRALRKTPGLGGIRMAVLAIVLSIASILWWGYVLVDQVRR